MKHRRLGRNTLTIALACIVLLYVSCSHEGNQRTLLRPKPIVTAEGSNTIPALASDARAFTTWAAAFRADLAADFPKAVNEYRAQSALEFITRSESYRKAPRIWSYFFSTSAPVMTMPALKTAYVAYYNPYVEASVIVLCRLDDDGKFNVLKATLRSNEELRSGRLAETNYAPAWLTSDQLPPATMANGYQQLLKDVSRTLCDDPKVSWPRLADVSPDTLDTVVALSANLLAELNRFQNGPDKTLGQTVRQLTAAIRDGNQATLEKMLPADNPMPPKNVTQVPAGFRRKVVPVAVVTLNESALLFLGNPELPWTYFAVAVEMKSPYRVGPMGMFDLNYARRPASTGQQQAIAQEAKK